MPYLTSLAAIARGARLRVVEQPGWQTRGHGAMSGVKTIVAHHTAGPATGNAPSLNIVQNGRSDLSGPLAHFVLGRDGTVFVVAAGLCWHTGATWQVAQGNAYAIGIEAEATGTASWPEAQLDAYARLCRALCAAFGLSVDRVQGHKEICSPAGRKTDPNFDMNAFRARVAKLTAGGGASTAGEDDDMKDDERRALFQLVEQSTGTRELDKYPGWQSFEYPNDPKAKATQTDYLRYIDQNVIRLAKAVAALTAKVDELSKKTGGA